MLDLSKFTIPKEAKWVAMDATGSVYAYAELPLPSKFANWWVHAGDGECLRIGKVDPSTINWRESLTPVGTVGTVGTVSPTDTLLAALLALDGMQECDLIAAFVRADPRRADAFCVTLAEALDPAQSAGATNETA